MIHSRQLGTALIGIALLLVSCDLRLTPRRAFVEVANLNLLHGFDCDPPIPGVGDQCRLRERVALLAAHLIEAGCPDVVTLQEVVNREFVMRTASETVGPLDSAVALIEAELDRLETACGFRYELLYDPFLIPITAETDEELILSRYPILEFETRPLHSALYEPVSGIALFARHALWARIDHPSGPLDVFTTHLASGADSATNPCDSMFELFPGAIVTVACPAECDTAGTVRECQARQLALWVEEKHDVDEPAVISGDLNAGPSSIEVAELTSRGWIDSHLAAGRPECDPTTGVGCTSGRSATSGDLEAPALGVDRRIDYIVVVPPAPGTCTLEFRDFGEPRHGITAGTGLFAHLPNPFAGSCGPWPLPICWTADHSGNQATFACGPYRPRAPR